MELESKASFWYELKHSFGIRRRAVKTRYPKSKCQSIGVQKDQELEIDFSLNTQLVFIVISN